MQDTFFPIQIYDSKYLSVYDYRVWIMNRHLLYLISPMPVAMIKPRTSPPNNAPSIAPMFFLDDSIDNEKIFNNYICDSLTTR